MKNEVKLKRIYSAPREDVFRYWIEPKLIEQWSAPEGMTLKVPLFEANKGGKYRYEHRQGEKLFLCNGHFEDFIPNEKLIQIDTVQTPEDGVMFENLRAEIIFRDEAGGTSIEVTQSGFQDEKTAKECEVGWDQCLDKLGELLVHRRFQPGQELRRHQVSGE